MSWVLCSGGLVCLVCLGIRCTHCHGSSSRTDSSVHDVTDNWTSRQEARVRVLLHATPCHCPLPPFPTLGHQLPPPSLLRSLVSACSCCPSCRSFQPTRSVINHRGSQLQWGWSGQTSLSLCQQGMPGITRHTTLIDAAPAHTPHFRQSARAGINSLLLDSMWRWGWGARRRRGEEIPFYDLLI